MRCQDFMTKGIETIDLGASAADAWRTMHDRRIHHLVVTTAGKASGVISDRDLGGKNGATFRKGRTVADLMAADFVTIGPKTTVRQVANLLRGRNIGCLPIVDRGRVVGIVTVSDLLELVGRGADRSGNGGEKRRQTRSPGGRRGPARPKR